MGGGGANALSWIEPQLHVFDKRFAQISKFITNYNGAFILSGCLLTLAGKYSIISQVNIPDCPIKSETPGRGPNHRPSQIKA